MFVLGFQEIVPLTAQQIVQADPEKRSATFFWDVDFDVKQPGRRVWEMRILETLDRRPKKKSDYVLLRSEQVSASALLVDEHL